MKERDYINATDLAKARIARQILNDMVLATEAERKSRDESTKFLWQVIARLEKQVEQK